MPPAHLAYTTNLTHHHSVGAGHARPAGFPLHPVQPKTVGEGFIPPAYPTPSPTQRTTRRGGIHVARAPCLYHQPTPPPPCRGRAYMPPTHLAYTTNLTLHHPVGAGRARPATLPLYPFYLNPVGEGFIPPVYPTPSLTKRFARADASIRPYKLGVLPSKSPTCTLPKNPPQNLSKKPKNPIDKSMTTCYNKQAVPRRTRREKRFITACICFLKKTSSKNFQKTP